MRVVHETSFGIIPLRLLEKTMWNVFLILHKRGNHWGFPKGKANPGEDPMGSAARELLEETGLEVEEFLQTEPIQEEYTFYRPQTKVIKKVSYFPALVSGAFLLQPEEIRDGTWLTFEQAEEQLSFLEAKKICKQIQILVSP